MFQPLTSLFLRSLVAITIGAGLTFAAPAYGQDKTESKAEKADAAEKTEDAEEKEPSVEPLGYFLGLSVGQQMRQNGFEYGDFELEALTAGMADGMQNKESILSDKQLRETQDKIQTLLGERRKATVEKQKQAGVDYLKANKDKDGVVELDSGLQYKVIKKGDGESPGPKDTISVHYTGKLIDGTVFDSSIKRGKPSTFRVDQVIPGWQEGLQKMKVGAKWKLFIPSDLAYGPRGSGGVIGPFQVLVFDVELLKIQ